MRPSKEILRHEVVNRSIVVRLLRVKRHLILFKRSYGMGSDELIAGINHHIREMDELLEMLAFNSAIAEEQLVAFDDAMGRVREHLADMESGC